MQAVGVEERIALEISRYTGQTVVGTGPDTSPASCQCSDYVVRHALLGGEMANCVVLRIVDP